MDFDRDTIGTLGENLALVHLLTPHGARPLFRATLLGEKWPTVDLLVERFGRTGTIGLIQVKATTRELTQEGRVPIRIGRSALLDMAAAPLPTYLVAVHVPTESAWIEAVLPDRMPWTGSLSTAFSLRDPAVRETLGREIDDFWAGVAPARVSRLTGEPR